MDGSGGWNNISGLLVNNTNLGIMVRERYNPYIWILCKTFSIITVGTKEFMKLIFYFIPQSPHSTLLLAQQAGSHQLLLHMDFLFLLTLNRPYNYS